MTGPAQESSPLSAAASTAAGIASRFTAARLAARTIAEYPGSVPQNSAEGYAIQELAISAWPDTVVGWKVARIGGPWAAQFPEPRLIGPVFSRNLHLVTDSTAPACPVFEGGFAAVETEIVIRVRADAPAGKTDWTLEEARDYVGAIHMGIEVASSPLPTLNDCGPGAVISDFGNNWGVVVGGEIPAWRKIESIDCETFVDGKSVGAKPVSMEQGPLSALQFTLGKAASRGRPLRAGAWITTGMITGVHDVRVGQQSRHVFNGFGEVGCRLVRAASLG
jgi:2-keto-4-pentenoate hydratase